MTRLLPLAVLLAAATLPNNVGAVERPTLEQFYAACDVDLWICRNDAARFVGPIEPPPVEPPPVEPPPIEPPPVEPPPIEPPPVEPPPVEPPPPPPPPPVEPPPPMGDAGWTQFSSSAISSVFPAAADTEWGTVGPRGVLNAWNNIAFDGTCLYAHGGGHTDYGGNEVYRWCDGTWQRFSMMDDSITRRPPRLSVSTPISHLAM